MIVENQLILPTFEELCVRFFSKAFRWCVDTVLTTPQQGAQSAYLNSCNILDLALFISRNFTLLIRVFKMDNQQFARLEKLSEKSFHKTIASDEFEEYLFLLDEWNVIAEPDYLE